MRRLLMTFVFTASTAAALLANHPATFVMRSGERISGDLSYKGGTAYTLNGRDIESRDVAVILFVNDDPSAAELNQIPQVDNNPIEHERHVFVTRDGKVTLGKLYKFSRDGETVTFDARDGGRRDVSANDMARIYINPAGARSVYSAILRNAQQPVASNDGVNRGSRQPGTTNRGSGYRNGGEPGASNSGGFDRNNRQPGERYVGGGNNTRVNGSQPWTDSGLDVRKGDLISFSATGEVRVWDRYSRQTVAAGPDGAVGLRSRRNNYPYRDMAVGGLIARVGNDRPFGIGTSTQPISMPANGRLFFGINDDEFDGNSGAFDVAIRMTRSWR